MTSGQLTLEIGDNEGVGPDSKYEIQLPSAGWPAPTKSIAPIGGGAAADVAGDTNAAAFDPATRTLSGALTNPDVPYGPISGLSVTYRAGAISMQGRHFFVLKTSSGPHAVLTAVAGDDVNIYPRYIDVTAKHDSGTFEVKEGGRTLVQSTPDTEHTLELVYTATGYMPEGQVTFKVPREPTWPLPRYDNGDATADVGEVTFSGKADFTINADGDIIAVKNAAWNAGDQIKVTYKKVKVPGAAADPPVEYTFTARASSFGGDATGFDETHKIGPGRAADGSGTLAVSPDKANASTATDLTLTYTATGTMAVGSVVQVTIPTNGNWPAPNDSASRVEIGNEGAAASLTSSATTMTATSVVALAANAQIVFKYNNVTTPAAGGQYRFTAQSRAHPGEGGLQPLGSGASVTIDEIAAGTAAIANADGAVNSAAPSMMLGNLDITFMAGTRMEAGSKVTVTIPAGWDAANEDNDDGQDAPGESSVVGAASLGVSGGGGTPWVLTATTNAVLEVGNTLIFTYKMATAPATEGLYPFTMMASITADGSLLPVHPQQIITVRKLVDGLAIVATPTSVFVGEDVSLNITLWSGTEAGRALGPVLVTLTPSSDTSVLPASVTIADDTNGVKAAFSDPSPGTVTITATAGDLTDSASVIVKSTIRDEKVSKSLVSQGQEITVSAIGPVGHGAVSVRNADGEKVGLSPSLDLIGEPDADGDQQYERTITLPDPLADGSYTVRVTINDDYKEIPITVLNDQSAPTLSDANVLPTTVVNGALLTLTVKATASSASNPVESVTADVSAVDSTQTDMLKLEAQPGTENTYFVLHTVSMDNTSDDGVVTVTFTATDGIGNSSTPATASVTLKNDATVIESVNVPSDLFRPGDTVTITATGTEGGTATFSIATGAHDVLVDKKAMMEDPDGTYTGSFPVVADVFPEGTYYVTVNLNTKSKSQSDLNIGPAGYTFTLSIPAGTHAIHIPLAANQVNGEDGTIETVGDVYNALGDSVRFIISFIDGNAVTYLGDESAGTMADAAINDDTGLVAVMKSAGTIELVGDALGTGGVSMVSINVGNNLVGLPLKPAAGLSKISDALVPGVGAIAISNAAGDGFHTIQAEGDTGDGPVMGGVGYVVVATAAANIPIVGSVWENEGAVMAAPGVAFSGSQTPVLYVEGSVMDEFNMLSQIPELRVTVRNLSTGASLDTVLGTEQSATAYSATFVELSRHAAKAGDVLEIIAHSPNPYVGVRPVPQIVVSAEEVLTSRISLPDMELYEIPSESELLANYPNPFNPETWIPYRLAQAAEVTLDIYDTNGRLVRTIDIGFKPAAVYESRASAIYWDGRNNYGERVASGTYFYHLTAGDDYASTRRMVILK